MVTFKEKIRQYLTQVVIRPDVPPELQNALKDAFCTGFMSCLRLVTDTHPTYNTGQCLYVTQLIEDCTAALDEDVKQLSRKRRVK